MKRSHVKCITVNTDASFSKEEKVAGYAFYIVCDLFKITKGGIIKSNVETPQDAEMMCMANALYSLLKQPSLPSTNLIIINSDALTTFEKIGLKKKGVGKRVAEILRQLRKEASYREVVMPKFEFRHVKAHNGTPDKRSFVNNWCDKEAKKWMREAKKIKQQQQSNNTTNE